MTNTAPCEKTVTRREQAAFGAALGLVAGFIARDLDLADSGVALGRSPLSGAHSELSSAPLCMTTRLRRLFVAATVGLVVLWFAVACRTAQPDAARAAWFAKTPFAPPTRCWS